MANLNNLFEDKNNNGIPDIMEENGTHVINSTQFIVEGKSYKSLDEMPPEVRNKFDAKMKQLNVKIGQSSTTDFSAQSFFNIFDKMASHSEPLQQSSLQNGSNSNFSFLTNKKINVTPILFVLFFIVLFTGPIAYFYFHLDQATQNLYKDPFILLEVSIGLLISGITAFFLRISFYRKGQLVIGKVVDINSYRGSKGGSVYKPIIEFLTLEGKKFQTTTKVGSRPVGYSIGEEVQLYYDPQNPEITAIKKFQEWLLSIMFIGIGAVFSLAAFTPLSTTPSFFTFMLEHFLDLFT